MATNFTAALLAICLVVVQLYCMGFYGSGPDSSKTEVRSISTLIENEGLLTGSIPDNDLVLSYDLAESPALNNIEAHLK